MHQGPDEWGGTGRVWGGGTGVRQGCLQGRGCVPRGRAEGPLGEDLATESGWSEGRDSNEVRGMKEPRCP